MEICDSVTVIRRGRTVAQKKISEVDEFEISKLMVGREVNLELFKASSNIGQVNLLVRNLKKQSTLYDIPVLDDVSLSVRAGEIVGIAGIEGNGQRELSEIITGMDQAYAGDVILFGTEKPHSAGIREIREAGVAHISEDRMTYGVASGTSIEENFIADRYYTDNYSKGYLKNNKSIRQNTLQAIEDFQVSCSGSTEDIAMLSGGNIQKVVAAREFTSNAKLIIANQPTRGIDIGASELIRNKLISLRDSGVAILLISADLHELLGISDRILVMHKGKVVAHFSNSKTLTEDVLGEYMLGLKEMSKEEMDKVVGHV